MIRRGDRIKCHSEADLKNWMLYLSVKGYDAVREPGLYILVISEPEGRCGDGNLQDQGEPV